MSPLNVKGVYRSKKLNQIDKAFFKSGNNETKETVQIRFHT